jgi:carboxymethylenebutenolidase
MIRPENSSHMEDWLMEKQIEIRTADGIADGFLYTPEGSGPWPGVIQLTDIHGVRPVARDLAKRIAAKGYVVLLPNVFYRTSKAPLPDFTFKPGDEKAMARFRELAGPLTAAAMESDGAAYVDFLANQAGVSAGKMGVVGYCFTAAMAMRTAAARPDRITAVAGFHGGRLFTDDPASPHTILPRIKARLYFGHAIEDHSMPKEAIEKFEQALRAWGGKFESEMYDGARHGWTQPDMPAYNEPQAERAFEKLIGLFDATLK